MLIALCTFALFAGGASEAKPAASEDSKYGGTLVVSTTTDVQHAFTTKVRQTVERAQLLYVYEGLTKINEDGTWSPWLAESLVGDRDALTYTIKLRKGVKYSDGSDMTAETVAWCMNLYKEISQSSGTYYGSVESINIVDDYTILVKMSQWDAMFPFNMALQAGYQYSKKTFDDHNGDIDWCDSHPVGTGPFILKEWKKDDVKIYERNENYWGGRPYLDKVEVRVIPDNITAQAALISGEIDILVGLASDAVKTMEAQGFTIDKDPTMLTAMLMVFSSEAPGSPFCDKRVREAVCYAIDSDAVNASVYDGNAIVSNQFAAPGSLWYNDQVVGYEYNPEKSKALLKEAGYPNGFTTHIYSNAVMGKTLTSILSLLQDYLKAVGITLELHPQDSALYSTTSIYGIEEGMILHGCSMPAGLVTQFVSNLSKRSIGGIGMLNQCMIHPDDLDEVIMKANAAATSEEAAKYMREAQKLNFDTYCLWYPLVLSPTITASNPKVHDAAMNCSGRDTSKTWIEK